MALEKNYSEKYYSELLKKYISGEISQKELFLLEKKALDDPFLFEAMQGYSETPSSDVNKNINSIRNKISARKKEKKRTSILKFIIPAAAASLLLLFAVSSIIRTNNLESAQTSVGGEREEELFALQAEKGDDNEKVSKTATSNKVISDTLVLYDTKDGITQTEVGESRSN
jgi:hypothetical protein